ncbi:hypothetical protein EDC01DRAFT_682701 [Geopyxis carbonaria]|nr:hypothetical protein EDC01DRAFT_682701 [Geopyxis carbonaria]
MSLSLFHLPQHLLELISSHLSLRDVASLRRCSHIAFSTFASPQLCSYLLRLHFPFAQEAILQQPTAYDALNAVLTRHSRLRQSLFSQTLDLAYPPPSASAERVYPSLHYFDPDTGALSTADSDLPRRKVEIATRWLGDGSGRSVVIPAPLEITPSYGSGMRSPQEPGGGAALEWTPPSPPYIVYSKSRILLVYNREAIQNATSPLSSPGSGSLQAGSLATILDAKHDGRTMWSALLSTPIFTGLKESMHHRKKRLQPVFNAHYLAFLTSLTSNGVLAIIRMPPADRTPLSPAFSENDTISAKLPVRPENLHSIAVDDSGNYLLVGESFPSHNNLHRIILVNAHNGESTQAYHLPMAPGFAMRPRDWSSMLSPTAKELLVFQSPRSDTYRSTMLGQVCIFSLLDPPEPTRIRYLVTPQRLLKHELITYDFASNAATIITPNTPSARVFIYPQLNLASAAAGTGELINSYNSLPPLSTTVLSPPPHPHPHPGLNPVEFEIGAEWAYLRSMSASSGETVIHLFRLSPATAMSHNYAGSIRSLTTSGWATPASGTNGPTVVDAEELARRLAAMSNTAKYGGGVNDYFGKHATGYVEFAASPPEHSHPHPGGATGWLGGKVSDAVRRVKSEKSKKYHIVGGPSNGSEVQRVTSAGSDTAVQSAGGRRWGWGRWRSGSRVGQDKRD